MTPLEPADYRRLPPEARRAVDEWLDRAGLSRATRIREGQYGDTLVTVATEDGAGQPLERVLPVPATLPFPWREIRQAAR